MAVDVKGIEQRVKSESAFVERVRGELGKVIVGQAELVEALLAGLLANGHILIEGVPGLAKSLAVATLARVIRASFHRLQFTPDLLPADLIGTLVLNPRSGEFTTRKGPVFANLVLADEINRAPAKVQSALLEAMQERQVTIGDQSYPLPEPFLVLATQNPIEQEGTYPLPEAQVDRFLFKVLIGYPSREEELRIMDRMAAAAHGPPAVQPVVECAEIVAARRVVDEIYVDDKIREYVADLVFATREPKKYGLDLEGLIDYGASPRASICLLLAARARAFLAGRPYVTPQDVKASAPDVLRHRVLLSYEAEAEELTADQVVRRVLDGVRVP